MKNIIDIFSEIVDTLRATGTITGISESSGVSTISSVNSLAIEEVIRMDKTFLAGEIKSVSSEDNDNKSAVEFTTEHKLSTGTSVTISGATEATYNATHDDINVISTTKVIINTPYVEELDTSNWAAISGIDYIIQSASSTEFTVNGTGITATTWKALAPYFIPDTPIKMVNQLTAKDKENTIKYQKYPLIWLKLNILEDEGKDGFYTVLNNPLFVIMNKSEINYTAVERNEINFKPILNPLYYQLLAAIEESYYFHESGDSLERQKKENYYWGTQEVVSASIVNDITDAVEMYIKRLSIQQVCE